MENKIPKVLRAMGCAHTGGIVKQAVKFGLHSSEVEALNHPPVPFSPALFCLPLCALISPPKIIPERYQSQDLSAFPTSIPSYPSHRGFSELSTQYVF